MRRLSMLVTAVAALSVTGCGGPTTAGPEPGATTTRSTAAPTTSSGANPRPVACTGVTDQGGLAAGAGTKVSLDQISKAVGFTVTTAMPDTQSALGSFNGYENCRYQFTTPAGGAQVDLTLVVGRNPLDGKDAATEYAATKSTNEPISDRNCGGNGCGYTFAPMTGLGDEALAGKQIDGTEVIVVHKGQTYLEIGPGGLKEERMVNLAQLVIGAVS